MSAAGYGRGGASLAVCMVALVTMAGCGAGGSDKPSTRLEGAVTLDRRPIAKGTIDFLPQQKGQAAPVTAQIVDGRYKVEGVPLGKVLARIKAGKETGREIAIPHSEEKYREEVSLIPLKYAQGISLEVTEDAGTRDFELTSK
ncbi:MAG: hypothetical protein NTW96_15995 [Planctomycetia bacterium]|nr:hypothetical protein [Planctomycetia bacterium]